MKNHLIDPVYYYQELHNKDDHILIDIRKYEEYQNGHINKAISLFRNEYQNNEKHASLICDIKTIETILNKINYNINKKIYIYDDRDSYDSCYLWWVLLYYGITEVYILDGGIKAWNQLKLPITNYEALYIIPHKKIKLEVNHSVIALLEDVQKHNYQKIIDTRSIAEYKGEMLQSGAKKTGRIKGAIHIDYIKAIDLDNMSKFKQIKELEKLYHDYLDQDIILYCQAGIRSALTFFVIYDLLGYHNVKNYAGSWMEYSHHV